MWLTEYIPYFTISAVLYHHTSKEAVMKKMFVLLNILCGAALVSVLFEIMPSRADTVFLVVTGFAFLSAFVGNLLYNKFDKTNGNDSGTIAFSLIVLVDIMVIILAPLLVLFGIPFLPVLIVALLAIVLWTGFLTLSLIR